MMNAPIQLQQLGNKTLPQKPVLPQPAANVNDPRTTALKEQSMAVSFDIAAEYSAITKMNNILADVAKEIKKEEDPERKKLLETRLNNINNMILQRELKINQMEQVKNQINNQII